MEELKKLIRDGQADGTAERVRTLLDGGAEPDVLLKQAMIPAMDEVGNLFQEGEYFMPEMLIAARAMQRGLDIIKPLLVGTAASSAGTVLLGTVAGDLHDIGKNLVGMSLEGAGFTVVDLGADVAPAVFADAVREHNPSVVGLSALLTTTLPAMEQTIEAIRDGKGGGKVRIMVGGAPLTEEMALRMGADFYGSDSVAGREFARTTVGA